MNLRNQLCLLLASALLFFPTLGKAEVREIQSLDGTWDIVFDEENIGRKAKWHTAEVFQGLEGQRKINVPSCWEQVEKDYEGVAFYRRMFTVPPEWTGKVVRLRFDAVNFTAEVWLNGTAVGIHEGGFTPFEFRVDDLLKIGAANTLMVRVVGPILMQDKIVDGMGPMETPQWRGAIAGGIWQSVQLVATDKIFVKDVFIEPNISNNTASFSLALEHTGLETAPANVEITICSLEDPDKVVAKIIQPLELSPGLNHQRLTVELPDAVYWSPDHPHLYRAEVNVVFDKKASDHWNTRFGMREFTIRDKQFFLNGRPMYLKATFFEGLYPLGLANPDSREMAIREIQLAKDAGFNMIRPWRKPPPQMWLDLADEIGVFTVGSLAVECMDFPVESAHLPRWVENEVRESILRDRNRTCVVQWELFNELKRPVLMRMLHPMAMLARELDPTRLILDESGGWAQGANMYLPYETEPIKFNDIHDYPGPQISDEVFNKLVLTGTKTHKEMGRMGLKGRLPGKNVVPGLISFFSELGYGSLPDLVENNRRFAKEGNPLTPAMVYHQRLADDYRQMLKKSGLDQIYPDLQQFCLDEQQLHGAANKRMIEAVRCNPEVKGYCIHALTAGDWIMGAGLLDLWRNPKTYAYEGTKTANQPRIVPIRVRPRNVYAEYGTTIEITGVNEAGAIEGNLSVEIVAEDGSIVFSKSTKTKMVQGIALLFEQQLDTTKLQGTYTVKVAVTNVEGSLVAENQYAFDVFASNQLIVPDQLIAVLDPWNDLKPFLKKSGIRFEHFSASTDSSLPVFVARTEGKTAELKEQFDTLTTFVKGGGTAVYLGGGGSKFGWGKPVAAPALLPVKAGLKLARGTWSPISHLVREHPIFNGLPVNCMMGPLYENVWAEISLVGVEGEMIAGAIGFDWFPDLDKRKRHYYGPGDVWYGRDMAVVPCGAGRCILSQLRLIDFLDKDPVADKILYNLIEFAAEPVE